MSITTYPLNGPTYDANDAAAYFSPRTSGVFSADEDFPVTADGSGLTVTVGAGRGWMHPERFVGFSVTQREASTLTLPIADGQRPRIDRIVLRYDAAAHETRLQVLQGTPDSSPTAPAISRTALIYDLCLAEVTRPAASTVVTAANIRDTRTDESLCGLVRDGVEKIPTDKLVSDAKATLDALAGSYSSGFMVKDSITLLPLSWADTGSGDYPYLYNAPVTGCTADMTPQASVLSTTVDADAAKLAPTCETFNGTVQFRAKSSPLGTITMQVLLFGPNASSSSGGANLGLSVVDGKLCVTYDNGT